MNKKRITFLCLCLLFMGCIQNDSQFSRLSDEKKVLLASGYIYDSWTLNISKLNGEFKPDTLAHAIIFLEEFGGKDRSALLDKSLESVNKTSIDVLFFENKNKTLDIRVNYAIKGIQIKSEYINSLNFNEIIHLDTFYLPVDSGFVFKVFVNDERPLIFETKIKFIEDIISVNRQGFATTST